MLDQVEPLSRGRVLRFIDRDQRMIDLENAVNSLQVLGPLLAPYLNDGGHIGLLEVLENLGDVDVI